MEDCSVPYNTRRLIAVLHCVLSNVPSPLEEWIPGKFHHLWVTAIYCQFMSIPTHLSLITSLPLQGRLELKVCLFGMYPHPVGHPLRWENKQETQTQQPCTTHSHTLVPSTSSQAGCPTAGPSLPLLSHSHCSSRPRGRTESLQTMRMTSRETKNAHFPFLQARNNFSPHLIFWGITLPTHSLPFGENNKP